MHLENMERKAKNGLKDVNFNIKRPEAGNCRLWHVEVQKKAIDYEKDIFYGLLMFITAVLCPKSVTS